MAGITPEGITIKRQSEVLTDIRERAKPIFQDLVPPGEIVDVSDSSTLGRLTALFSIPVSDLWELAQQVYNAFDPNAAEGIALDNIVALLGVVRRGSTNSSAVLNVWGTEGTYIPASTSEVRTQDNNMYLINDGVIFDRKRTTGFLYNLPAQLVVGRTYGFDILQGSNTISIRKVTASGDTHATILINLLSQVNLHSSLYDAKIEGDGIRLETKDLYNVIEVTPVNNPTGLAELRFPTNASNEVVGAIPQEPGTISIIATPILGWVSVSNPFPAVLGRGVETDEELRLRFQDVKFRSSQNISDSLYSALIDIPSVKYARIFENETSVTNTTYNLPPHSFKAVVLGGSSEDIAKAIWLNKPLGIGANGNTTVQIRDSQGFLRDIKFDRPVNKNIYIKMTIKTNNDFPSNGDDLIKSALIKYFDTEFGIGQDVVYSRLYTPINSVPGHQVNNLTIGTTSNPTGTANITIGYNEISSLSTANIQIIHA